MTIGQRIKSIRKIRGLTQKELGLECGFTDSTSDVRIRQYESDSRVPKEETLKTIAKALKINYRLIFDLEIQTSFDILFTFFELEQENKISIKSLDEGCNITLSFNNDEGIAQLFKEWKIKKEDFYRGVITEEEYLSWKMDLDKGRLKGDSLMLY